MLSEKEIGCEINDPRGFQGDGRNARLTLLVI